MKFFNNKSFATEFELQKNKPVNLEFAFSSRLTCDFTVKTVGVLTLK